MIDAPMASVIGVVVTVIGTLIGVLIGKRKVSAEARAIDSEATSKREAAVQDQYARLVKTSARNPSGGAQITWRFVPRWQRAERIARRRFRN